MTDPNPIALPEPRSNIPVTLIHRVEYGLLRATFFVFRLIGVDASSALGGWFMRLVGPLLPVHTKRGRENLKAAFPDWSPQKIDATLKGVWDNLGRTTAEFAHLKEFRPFEANGRVKIVGLERIEKLVREKTPAIFIGGHMANWEIMAIALQRVGLETAVVYRPANKALVDALIIKKRARVMSHLQIPKGQPGFRKIIEAAKSGHSIALLADQKLNDGIAVPFFGRSAMTTPAAARLALKFNMPIIIAGIERLEGAHFKINVHEPIAFSPSGETAKDVYELTRLMNVALEQEITARPDQWLWLHRRWPAENTDA